MSNKIFLLENTEGLSDVLKKDIERSIYNAEVYQAYSVSYGKYIFEENKDTFDCYIIDLNLKGTGISTANQEKSLGGKITGWFFVTEVLMNDLKNENDRKKFLEKIIFYTAYAASFKHHYEENERKNTPGYSKKFDELNIVSKAKHKTPLSNGDELINLVKKIIKI